ncbi:MAG: type II toxin-antitoxin system VapB family antitoxin [Chitinophagaceae bacterium]
MKIEAVDIKNISGKQAIQLPDDLRINDDKVYLKKIGNVIYIIPFHAPWQTFFDSLSSFSSDFMSDRNQPSQQSRDLFE